MDGQDLLALPECLEEVENNFSDLFPTEFDNSFSDRKESITIYRDRDNTSYSSSPQSSPESNTSPAEMSPSSSGYFTESSNDGSDKLNVKKRKYTEEVDSVSQARLSSDTKQVQDTTITIPQVKQEFKKPRFRIQPGCSKSEFASAQAANPELRDDIQQGRVFTQQPTPVNAKAINTANARLGKVKASPVENTQQKQELVFYLTPLEETPPSFPSGMHSSNHTNLSNTPPAPSRLDIGLDQHHANTNKSTDVASEHKISSEGMIGPVGFTNEQALQKQKVTQGKPSSRMPTYVATPPLRSVGGFVSSTPGGSVMPGNIRFVRYPLQQQHRLGHTPSIPQSLPWGGSYHAYLQQQYAANIQQQYRRAQLQQPQQVWPSSQPSSSPYYDGSLLGRSNRVKEAGGVLHDPTKQDWVKAQHLKYLKYHLELYNSSRKM